MTALKNGLALTLTIWLCFPALGQEALTGNYERIGRRCADNKKLIPVNNSTQELSFDANGSFRHKFYILNIPNAPEEEFWREKRERKIAQAIKWTKEEIERHEADCSIDQENGCGPDAQKLYDQLRRQRIAEAEEEVKKEREELKRDIERHTTSCFMETEGSWTENGNGRLTLLPQSIKASPECGAEANYPPSLNVGYYFEDGGNKLHLIFPAPADKKKYCSGSNWEEIYSRQ